MVSGRSRCKIGLSCSYKLMGVGGMSTPEKEDPTGLDNVSYIFYFRLFM